MVKLESQFVLEKSLNIYSSCGLLVNLNLLLDIKGKIAKIIFKQNNGAICIFKLLNIYSIHVKQKTNTTWKKPGN